MEPNEPPLDPPLMYMCTMHVYVYWQANLHHQCELNHADGMSPCSFAFSSHLTVIPL